MEQETSIEIAVFGGGCFWCTEAVFSELRGVISIMPGYSGGTVPNPTSEMVYRGNTGHAEVAHIEFDPSKIKYEDLLTIFFATHDPTTLNRQGADIGTEYRSVIFYTTDTQKLAAEQFIQKLNASGPKVVTEVTPFVAFYPAEESHRRFYDKNPGAPYCQVVINPKLAIVKARFHELLNDSEK